nr:MAG TPA: hypothetical protein [Caudoviricetes sp.]
MVLLKWFFLVSTSYTGGVYLVYWGYLCRVLVVSMSCTGGEKY